MTAFDSIFRRLANRELITPYLENALLSQDWPDSYNVVVDSSPYYGLGDGYFHPSSHGLLGARQLYYMFHEDHREKMVWERRSVQSEMTLAMGTAIHAVVQTQFVQAGLCTPEDIEVEYINQEHHLRGRLDFIVNHPNGDRVPVELKTQNIYSFRKQDTIKDIWDSQLSMALDNLGYPMGILLVAEAGWPYTFKEFRVTRNDKLLTEIYTKFDYVRERIELNIPPKHCCTLGSPEMKECPARFECWLANQKVSV